MYSKNLKKNMLLLGAGVYSNAYIKLLITDNQHSLWDFDHVQ